MNMNPVGWPGRGLQLFARLFNSSPNSITPVTAISEAPIGATNADIALVAKGTGATLAQVPDGTAVGGDKRGTFATDLQKSRSTSAQVASGTASVICGGNSNSSSATQSTIVGGISNTASSNYSFVGGGQSNAAQTNTHATVGGGNSNTASGSYSFVGGGLSGTASGSYSGVLCGNTNAASAQTSTVAGGEFNTANAVCSIVIGGRRGITRSIEGNCVFPSHNSPIASVNGITQSARLLLARETTSATATVLTSNSSAASTTNQVILPDRSAYSFSGEVIANVTGGGDTARWTINGAIKRGGGAATTAMVGTPTVTMTHNDAGAAAWVVAVTADTTNGGIAVTVTGAAATTIRWVAKIDTTEVTY